MRVYERDFLREKEKSKMRKEKGGFTFRRVYILTKGSPPSTILAGDLCFSSTSAIREARSFFAQVGLSPCRQTMSWKEVPLRLMNSPFSSRPAERTRESYCCLAICLESCFSSVDTDLVPLWQEDGGDTGDDWDELRSGLDDLLRGTRLAQ